MKVIDWQQGASLRILSALLIVAVINFIQSIEAQSRVTIALISNVIFRQNNNDSLSFQINVHPNLN